MPSTKSGFGATRCEGVPRADMASERTFVTELATGLGMFGDPDLDTVIRRRPAEFVNLSPDDWERLGALWSGNLFGAEFVHGFINGREFLTAPDALNGRPPRIVEWTGGRRPPGDEVVPSDLRIDHVYLVSCKYLSGILHNPSPARLVEGLLSQAPIDDARDWYDRIAPSEYQELYEACSAVYPHLPGLASEMSTAERRALAKGLAQGWPPGGLAAYERLCRAVSRRSADAWSEAIGNSNAEAVAWRLLRIGSAPYFVLGSSHRSGPMRLRIDTPWDWRQRYRFRRLSVEPQIGGQPRVGWTVAYDVNETGESRIVRGHVEIRWSHGRFGQPPEAKVYLDSRHEDVPGYHAL
jgi:hypothetical protein